MLMGGGANNTNPFTISQREKGNQLKKAEFFIGKREKIHNYCLRRRRGDVHQFLERSLRLPCSGIYAKDPAVRDDIADMDLAGVDDIGHIANNKSIFVRGKKRRSLSVDRAEMPALEHCLHDLSGFCV